MTLLEFIRTIKEDGWVKIEDYNIFIKIECVYNASPININSTYYKYSIIYKNIYYKNNKSLKNRERLNIDVYKIFKKLGLNENSIRNNV
jgi:hypothetical protein